MTRVFTIALLFVAALPTLPAQDLDPLVVQILPVDDARLRGRGLPILFRGMRPTSFEQLQEWMRVVTAPDEVANQDLDGPAVTGPSAAFPKGRHPSNRTLVIRCGPHEDAAWVQAVALAAWFLPDGKSLDARIRKSPLLADVRIGLLDEDTRTPVRIIRNFRSKADGTMPALEDLLLRIFPSRPWPKDLMPEVTIQLGAYEPITTGKCTDYRLHRSNSDAASFEFKPKLFPFRFREALAKLRKEDTSTQIRVIPDLRVPYVVMHEMLQIVKANELTAVFETNLGLPALRELARRGTSGAVETRPDAAAAAPSSDQPDQGPIPAEKIQFALDNSLKWLMTHQAPDGRWDADQFPGAGKDGMLRGIAMYDVGVTGMAVLAFLDAGHAPHAKGPYQATLEAALSWLKAQQDAEGCIGARGDPHFVYGHAVAAEAIVRAYQVSEPTELKAPAQSAVNFIQKAQNPYRAWRYGVRPGDNDSSVTAWMLSALAAGKAAGLDLNGNGISWAMDYLLELTDKDTGRTGYTKPGERPVRAEGRQGRFPAEASEALTAMSLWCRNALDPKSAGKPLMAKGQALLLKTLPNWNPNGSVDMIYWFWGSRSLKALQADGYEHWRRPLARALIENQRREGDHVGGFRPEGAWGLDGGAVYSTALMARTLATLR